MGRTPASWQRARIAASACTRCSCVMRVLRWSRGSASWVLRIVAARGAAAPLRSRPTVLVVTPASLATSHGVLVHLLPQPIHGPLGGRGAEPGECLLCLADGGRSGCNRCAAKLTDGSRGHPSLPCHLPHRVPPHLLPQPLHGLLGGLWGLSVGNGAPLGSALFGGLFPPYWYGVRVSLGISSKGS